jgi:hypothetical protein
METSFRGYLVAKQKRLFLFIFAAATAVCASWGKMHLEAKTLK